MNFKPKQRETQMNKNIKKLKDIMNKKEVTQRKSTVWRAPGRCEIPNVFGKSCFLQPEPIPDKKYNLRVCDPKKHISRKPWLSAGCSTEIPKLPALIKVDTTFKERVKRYVPKIPILSVDPCRRHDNFKEIGFGTHGYVLSAQRKTKKREYVAIKRYTLDYENKISILRELRIMALNNSNIIQLKEVTIWKKRIWMTIDLMRCSIFDILCKRSLPEHYTVYITYEILKGLEFLHLNQYIHRNLKSENVLIGWNGEIKLANFSLSTMINKTNYEFSNSSQWTAPEIICKEPYNEKVDIWSLGITIIEMIDRIPPHYNCNNEFELFQHILNEPSPTFIYNYPSMYMRGLVAWSLLHDPNQRPNTSTMLKEMENHIEGKLLHTTNSIDLVRFLNRIFS